MTDNVEERMTIAILEYYEQGLDMSDPAVAKVAIATLKAGDELDGEREIVTSLQAKFDRGVIDQAATIAAEKMREDCLIELRRLKTSFRTIDNAIDAILALKVTK